MSRIGTRTLCNIPYLIFNLSWYSVQLHILSMSWLLARLGVDGHGGYILNRKNPLLLNVMKVICHCWRSLLTTSQLFGPYFFYFPFLSFFFFFCIFIFRIILFGFVICCINRNLYFLAQQRTGNLLKVMGYGLFQKKTQTSDRGLTVEDINFPGILKKEHVEIPGFN